MYHSQLLWRELDHAIRSYGRRAIFDDLLEPWVAENDVERRWLADFDARTRSNWSLAASEDLCRLYAIFRVTSLLLLSFQRGRVDGMDHPGPPIGVEAYQLFHEALGFHVPQPRNFHPFFHEIIAVEQSPDPDEPVQILQERWPALMLGPMMFCRAGVVVSAGESHLVKSIAEKSKLYWTYWRKDRPCHDLSRGWGGNSQWRTSLRRDYQTETGFVFGSDNVGMIDPNEAIVDGLPVTTMIELVRHRCVVRTGIADSDLYPYSYGVREDASGSLLTVDPGWRDLRSP